MIIYQTTNLLNGKKYIGKDSHNNPNYLGSGVLLKEDIKKYGKENFKKEILEYCDTDEDLTIRETYWINYFKAIQSNMYYNLVDFSAGWNISKLGEEKYNIIRHRISEASKGVLKPELSNNQERSEKLRQANIGKSKPEGFGKIISNIKLSQNLKYTDEHKRKISEGKLGKPHPKSGKRILQLDKEGNILQEHNSIYDAAKYIGKKQSNISCCLTGKSKTAYGYQWRYL